MNVWLTPEFVNFISITTDTLCQTKSNQHFVASNLIKNVRMHENRINTMFVCKFSSMFLFVFSQSMRQLNEAKRKFIKCLDEEEKRNKCVNDSFAWIFPC